MAAEVLRIEPPVIVSPDTEASPPIEATESPPAHVVVPTVVHALVLAKLSPQSLTAPAPV